MAATWLIHTRYVYIGLSQLSGYPDFKEPELIFAPRRPEPPRAAPGFVSWAGE
ncbi:hypothetical protein [Micromonospora avicenniae]|uniref:hypothetical protein n=1 Tax=Micromonospora avicenniae TaxID=1198245 RepID=UPI003449FBBA